MNVSLPNIPTSPQRRKRARNAQSFSDQLAQKICRVFTQSLEQRTALAEDDDRNFLLSLVKDLKSVPTGYKLDVKMETMSILKK
jgi:hypothetical protein